MKKIKIILLIITLICSIASCAQTTVFSKQQLAQHVDSFTKKIFERIPVIPSLVISIVDENGPFFIKGYGWADKEAGIKADETTLYYIASCTKSFMGLTAALLDHEKKLFLDSSFKKYLTAIHFKNEIGNNVTNRNLLTHTSGLENNPLVFRMAYSGAVERNEILNLL